MFSSIILSFSLFYTVSFIRVKLTLTLEFMNHKLYETRDALELINIYY